MGYLLARAPLPPVNSRDDSVNALLLVTRWMMSSGAITRPIRHHIGQPIRGVRVAGKHEHESQRG